MPIYEYRRPDGSTFEVRQRMADDALATDPESGEPVTRVLSAPAIHFKGSGFYNTDYGTARKSRELETSAKEGADNHDAKQAEKKKGSGDSSSSSSDSSASSKSSGSGGSSDSSKPAAASSGKG